MIASTPVSALCTQRGETEICLKNPLFNFLDTSGEIQAATVCVSLTDLENRARLTKSESSARNYLAMLRRLRTFNGSDSIALDDISPAYVAAFGQYLLEEGVSPSSVALFRKFFRAMFKDVFGKERHSQFKEAFRDVSSRNVKETRSVTLSDVRAIARASIPMAPLRKIRDLFLFSLYGAGIPLSEISQAEPEVEQQELILMNFRRLFSSSLQDYAAALSEECYLQGLTALSHHLRLTRPLRATSAAEGWAAAAREAGVSPAVIASTIRTSIPFSSLYGECLRPTETGLPLAATADLIDDIRPRWYVMRCSASTPAALAETLSSNPDISDTFIPSGAALPYLFFRATAEAAPAIRRSLFGKAYVYTFSGTSTPAYITGREMLTFMLLNEAAPDTVDCHFPDRAHPDPSEMVGVRARITVGNLSGQVGIISRPSKDRCRVLLEFTSLGAARVTAEIPLEFLTLLP